VLNASRKKRIAAGSGTSVQEVNKLLKMHRQMADTMKKFGKNKGMLSQLMGGGGMPDMPPEAMAEAQKMAESGQMPGGMAGGPSPGMPGGLPGLGGGAGMGGMPGGLPGLGGMPAGGRNKRSATKKRPKRKR
jgi:signal recognition particle subunit SRP54